MPGKIAKKFETKLKKSSSWAKLGQFIYLTIHGFNKCNLWESSYSCSFGFVFSFVPILLMIVSLLANVLQSSPAAISFVYSFADQIKETYDITSIVDTVLNNTSTFKFTVVDIVLFVWIFWMGRKMFLSIVYAMNRIFRSRSQRKATINQIVILVSEIVMILIVVLAIIVSFVFNKFIQMPIFDPIKEKAPRLFSNSSSNLMKTIIYLILFVIVTLVYRFVSGTAPDFKRCAFFGALCSLAFFILSFFLNKFYKTTNYNLIYGTISTLIILMAKIYFFFVIFLYGAEMLYVSQFFDSLIRSEVYLRPEFETKNFNDWLRKILFVNATAISTSENTRNFEPGDIIFKKGDDPLFVYYVCKGIIHDEEKDRDIGEGEFIGDIPCVLNQKCQGNFVARTNCKLMFFTEKEFLDFLKENSKAAAKALSKISTYSTNIYPEDGPARF